MRCLPALARNEIPEEISTIEKAGEIPAWVHLEDAIFFFFRQMLMLETHQLGSQCLFRREPEGLVLVDNVPDSFALLYECKARKDSCTISADDARRYKDYVKAKQFEVKARYRLSLTHFVIISSEFGGDFQAKIEEISLNGVLVSLCPAKELLSYYDLICSLDFTELRCLDIRRFFRAGLIMSGTRGAGQPNFR